MAGLRDICFVHLGKYGDIMIMLPAFKAVADETGTPPICVVSTHFWDIFEGVSYVRPWPMNVHWWGGVKRARQVAERAGFDPIVVKWWDEPGAKPPPAPPDEKTITLRIHGQTRKVAESEWDSFQSSQWRFAGFTMQQMKSWPLVFDRRDRNREQALCLKHMKQGKKHLLVNLSSSGTSPFPHSNLALALAVKSGMSIINLAGIRAHRIYDLLGLYDRCTALLTSDTATLHLAAASKIPYVAMLNNGGAGSVPKGNCVLSVRYAEVPNRQTEIFNALTSLNK